VEPAVDVLSFDPMLHRSHHFGERIGSVEATDNQEGLENRALAASVGTDEDGQWRKILKLAFADPSQGLDLN